MKKLGIMAVISFFVVSFVFADATVSSEISEVTLFTNQAQVKRTAQTSVESGLNKIQLDVDAYNVDSDSVSAKVYGDGEIYSVQLRQVPLKEAPQENIKKLEDKLESLKDRKKSLGLEMNILKKKEKFINSLLDFAKVEIPKELKTSFPRPDDLEKTLAFLDTSLSQINKSDEELAIKIREVDKDIKVTEKELAALRRPRQKYKNAIEILFNSKRDQKVKIEASYLVYSAYWQPFYKVDVPLDLKDVDLTMFSKISQTTGEDWKKITLSISNVVPLRGVGLPQLDSWDLEPPHFKQESRLRMMDYEVAMKSAAMEEVDDAYSVGYGAPAPEPAEFAQAAKQQLPLSFEYRLPQALDIQSQDKETILPLFSKTLKGDFFHYAVPKMNALTFLVCEAAADKELLAGYLNVYFGGRFIGKTYLPEKKAGEEFNINLGADREVKVKREKIKDKIRETFFGKIERQTIIRDMEYKISIENLKDKPMMIKILDNIPVSKTDKIVVKDVKLTPEPKEKDYQDREGVNLWEFDINAKGKKEITIEFTITYPKDHPVYGL